MKRLQLVIVGFLWLAPFISAQAIPRELWGRWIVRRDLAAKTISCWGEAEIKELIGAELEYSAELFRWKNVVTDHPIADARIVSAEQFHAENSGQGTNSSEVTFRQLGISAKQAKIITIHHTDANISGATTEIPGDAVLIKNANTIIFSICNVYFEARRAAAQRK